MSNKKNKIGKYEIVSTLGEGAMGVVYKAHDPVIDRYVAIKTQLLNLPDAKLHRLDERFITEARAAGRLNHPNIVGLYDFGEDGECAFIVMELISGFPLSDYISGKIPITLEQIWDTIFKVLDGIQYAHDHNVIHRDIKPSNIMRNEAGEVKITDFGIAQVDKSNLTVAGAVVGTPRYMPPERIRGKKGDYKTDIYSSGIVLYELVTGSEAFHGVKNVQMLLTTELSPVSELRPDCPKMMDAVIAKAVAKDPQDRYRSAKEFADGIRKVLDESPANDADLDNDATVLHRVSANTQAELPAKSDSPADDLKKRIAESGLSNSKKAVDDRPSSRKKWMLPIFILVVLVSGVLVYFLYAEKDAVNQDILTADEPAEPVQSPLPTPVIEPEVVSVEHDKQESAAELEADFVPELDLEPESQSEPELDPGLFSGVEIGAEFLDCPYCPSMVVLPPGESTIGSKQTEEEQPVHKVRIPRPFAVGKFEVSRQEFAKFVAATGYTSNGCRTYENNEWLHREERNWQSPGYIQQDIHPVTCVSWSDASAYVSWLSEITREAYRLLSSSEWEYLARSGRKAIAVVKDSPESICRFANVADLSAQYNYPGWLVHNCNDYYTHTAPVNNSNFEINELGVGGLFGNVFEWVSDCWNANYQNVPRDGSAQLTGDCSLRVLRGGSWFSQPDFVRFGFRNRFDKSARTNTFGFRVARELHPDEVISMGAGQDK